MSWIPCEHCGRRSVHLTTDGIHGKVYADAHCDCPAARREREECIDCGWRVPRTHPTRMAKWRCPKHHAAHERREDARRKREAYARDAERFRERVRAAYHADVEASRTQHRRRNRRYREMARRIRRRA